MALLWCRNNLFLGLMIYPFFLIVHPFGCLFQKDGPGGQQNDFKVHQQTEIDDVKQVVQSPVLNGGGIPPTDVGKGGEPRFYSKALVVVFHFLDELFHKKMGAQAGGPQSSYPLKTR